jgi:hypothetical protein
LTVVWLSLSFQDDTDIAELDSSVGFS